MGVVEDLVRAREAYERREWVAAYDALSDVGTSHLAADDFVRLATAAYLLGHHNDCLQALQRAYQVNVQAQEPLSAVRCAFWLAMVLNLHGEAAIGAGWTARAQRLLEDVPEDVVERGYVRVLSMFQSISTGDLPSALALAGEVTEYGRRCGDPDLLAVGLSSQGRLLLYTGEVPDGVGLLDEAMVGLTVGEVSPIFAGVVYCSMIEACQDISDFGRAAEWTSALTTWCDSQPGLVPFTGQCAVHRGQIMRMRGAYDEALHELDGAVERYLSSGAPAAAGRAHGERGDVLRIQGDLARAEAAYTQAASYGHDPHPGLALLWLAQGRGAAALAAVRRLLAEPRDPVHRSQLLPGAFQVLLACGATDEAAAVARELEAVASRFRCVPLRAMAGHATGSVLLARDDGAGAVPPLQRAVRLWGGLGADYDVARCRMLLAHAYRRLGDLESAAAELAAARGTFAALGAAPTEHETARLQQPSLPGGLTAREVEVLRLVASGSSNPEIAATLVLSEKTVARHLSNIFAKIDVRSRTAAAGYAFEHHLV